MSDPRYTDPRLDDPRNDPNFIQPAPLRDESTGGVWGWIAGLAVVALIAFVVLAGWNNSSSDNAANTNTPPAPITTGDSGPVRNVTPPSTTGSGSSSPMTNPATPNPAAPSAPPAASPPAAPAQQ